MICSSCGREIHNTQDGRGVGKEADDHSILFNELQSAYFVLRSWKRNPAAKKRKIGLWAYGTEDRAENDRPLSEAEVERMKPFLRPARGLPVSLRYFQKKLG